jgi:hypothetical protein
VGHNGGAGGAEGLVQAGGEVGQAPGQAHLPLPQLGGQLLAQPLLHLRPAADIVQQPAQKKQQFFKWTVPRDWAWLKV